MKYISESPNKWNVLYNAHCAQCAILSSITLIVQFGGTTMLVSQWRIQITPEKTAFDDTSILLQWPCTSTGSASGGLGKIWGAENTKLFSAKFGKPRLSLDKIHSWSRYESEGCFIQESEKMLYSIYWLK